jgi:Flp pilus assembly protein TadD
LVLYWPAVHGPFVFDDVVVRDSTVSQLESLDEAWAFAQLHGIPRKFTMFTFAANARAFGLDPFSFHLVNILLHATVALLLAWLVTRLLRAQVWRPRLQGLAEHVGWAGAVLWMVHPVQTQAVAYVWQRSTLLCAAFYLAGLVAYTYARGARGVRRASWLLLTLACGAIALLAKENGATFLAAVLLLEWTVYRVGHLAVNWRHTVVALLLVAATAAVSYDLLGPNYRSMIDAAYRRRGWTVEQRLLTQTRVVVHYASLLAFPNPSRLTLDYDFPLSTGWWKPPSTLWSGLVLLGLAVAALGGVRRHPLAALGGLWFLGHLVIESTFVPLDLIFEHRLYLPTTVPLALLAAVVVTSRERRLAIAAGIAVISLFSIWTWQRAHVWGDPVRLWTDNAAKSPAKPRVHANLAKVCLEAGRYDCAQRSFVRALELDPQLDGARIGLGIVALETGDHDRARQVLDEVARRSPSLPEVWLNLGVLENRRGRFEDAVRFLAKGLALEPNHRLMLFNMAAALLNAGDLAAARDVLTHARAIWPLEGDLAALDALRLAKAGDADGARRERETARRLGASRELLDAVTAGTQP